VGCCGVEVVLPVCPGVEPEAELEVEVVPVIRTS